LRRDPSPAGLGGRGPKPGGRLLRQFRLGAARISWLVGGPCFGPPGDLWPSGPPEQPTSAHAAAAAGLRSTTEPLRTGPPPGGAFAW